MKTNGLRLPMAALSTLLLFACSSSDEPTPDLGPDATVDGTQPADLLVDGPVSDTTADVQSPDLEPAGPWREVSLPTPKGILALWGRSATDIFAVGRDGALLNYDGARWTSIDSRVTEDLHDVIGFDDGTVVAVGDGVILYYDGADWRRNLTLGSYRAQLRSIWGTSPSQMIAVGLEGVIRQGLDPATYFSELWTGTTTEDLWAVKGFSEREIFVAGGAGTLLSYDYDADEFVEMARPGQETLRSLWGESSSDLYAAGDKGALLHYDGSSWQTASLGIGDQSVIDFHAGVSAGGGVAWLVGESVSGAAPAYRYDGTAWQAEAPTGAGALDALWATGSEAWVASGLRLWHYQSDAN